MKSRIYTRGNNVTEGDWIYYQKEKGRGKEKIWRGPAKVVAVNGKKLFIDQGARLSTVNRDCAVRVGEEFWRMDHNEKDTEEVPTWSLQEEEPFVSAQRNEQLVLSHQEPNEEEIEEFIERSLEEEQTLGSAQQNEELDRCFQEHNHSSSTLIHDDELPMHDDLPSYSAQSNEHGIDDSRDTLEEEDGADTIFTYKNIKVGNVLQFKDPLNNQIMTGVVTKRAGKAIGKNKSWWNMENVVTGEAASFDTEQLKDLTKVAETRQLESNKEATTMVEETFLVTLPRWRHKEERCIAAKEKELQNWVDFGTYEEVKDEGQKTLGLNWVLVEKIMDGKVGVKARLTVRGDQEKEDLRTDSPTIHKINIELFFLIAVSKGWKIKTSDVKCAFLQGTDLDRDVYVRPPLERRTNGVIWKMIR